MQREAELGGCSRWVLAHRAGAGLLPRAELQVDQGIWLAEWSGACTSPLRSGQWEGQREARELESNCDVNKSHSCVLF